LFSAKQKMFIDGFALHRKCKTPCGAVKNKLTNARKGDPSLFDDKTRSKALL
jgi:hypothetical protein